MGLDAEEAMNTSAQNEKTVRCQECAKTATLIAVVRSGNGTAAHHVFKCDNCGYFNWIDEAQPRIGAGYGRVTPLAQAAVA